MPIIQHLIVDEYGAFVGKHSERLVVSKGRQKLQQAPLLHLESVIITGRGISISADAVQVCAERGIPIHFLDALGMPAASLYSAGLTGTVRTRRAQLMAYTNGLGLHLALAFSMAKLQNQANLLKYHAKYRKQNAPEVYESLRDAAIAIEDGISELTTIQQYPEVQRGEYGLEDLRAEVMGIEGNAASRYWGAFGTLLSEKYAFPGRMGRGARDPVNSLLNYGYGVLYTQVERALVLAGLDPYAGFLHSDRPGKPSMVLDFIEEFRQPVVDRTVLSILGRGQAVQQEDDGLLSSPTRKMLVEKIFERLERRVEFEKKKHPLRAVLQMQARHIATYLRLERETYTPYIFAW